MADWYGSARSNYFKVKDAAKFLDWIEFVGDLGFWESSKAPGSYAIYSEDQFGGWPSLRFDADSEDYVEFDMVDELAAHLVEGEVAVLMECGAEKLRYLTGHALAINHLGASVVVRLTDIYALAKEKFGVDPSDATY